MDRAAQGRPDLERPQDLSVLLDTYYGVMQRDEHVAHQRVEDAFNP